jgi:hypothetical protein
MTRSRFSRSRRKVACAASAAGELGEDGVETARTDGL